MAMMSVMSRDWMTISAAEIVVGVDLATLGLPHDYDQLLGPDGLPNLFATFAGEPGGLQMRVRCGEKSFTAGGGGRYFCAVPARAEPYHVELQAKCVTKHWPPPFDTALIVLRLETLKLPAKGAPHP